MNADALQAAIDNGARILLTWPSKAGIAAQVITEDVQGILWELDAVTSDLKDLDTNNWAS